MTDHVATDVAAADGNYCAFGLDCDAMNQPPHFWDKGHSVGIDYSTVSAVMALPSVLSSRIARSFLCLGFAGEQAERT